MESAHTAVNDGEPIVIHNIRIALHESNKNYYGHFELNAKFCKDRHIKIVKNSKDDDEESNDYLCIRVPQEMTSKPGIGEILLDII